MNKDDLHHYANGKVTTGTTTLLTRNGLMTFFVGKLRGETVSTAQGYKFHREEDGKRNATAFRQWCRDEITVPPK